MSFVVVKSEVAGCDCCSSRAKTLWKPQCRWRGLVGDLGMHEHHGRRTVCSDFPIHGFNSYHSNRDEYWGEHDDPTPPPAYLEAHSTLECMRAFL